jgi:hypothetical protein
MLSPKETRMQLRYGLTAAAMVVFVSLAPSTRAHSAANNSAGVAIAAAIDGSKGEATSTDRGEAGVGNPAPGPGLLLFAATAFAYLWYWKPKPRTSQKSETATLA